MYHSLFIHSSTGGHLGSLQTLVTVNDTVNTGVPIFFQIGFSGSLGNIPRSGIAGSNGVPFLIF